MLAAVGELTSEQWNFKPDADTWSVGECLEHVAMLEGMILQNVLEAPELAELPDVAGKEQVILARVSEARRKVTAPEFARPVGRWAADELMAAFARARQATIELAVVSEYPFRWKAVPISRLGCWTAISG